MNTNSVTAQLLAEQKAEREKRLKKYALYGGVFLVLALLTKWLFTPFQGGMPFGICKTFLELQVRYPQTLHLSMVDETLDKGATVRIWYTQMDAFGQYRLEPIECTFRRDPVLGAALDKVRMNRIDVDPAVVARFNVAIPALLANPPNLDLPNPLPENLENLQVDTMGLRTRLFQ